MTLVLNRTPNIYDFGIEIKILSKNIITIINIIFMNKVV